MIIETFINKWLNHKFENLGTVVSTDYKQFQKEYKAIIKQIAKENDFDIYTFNSNHYEFSCVLKHTETLQFIYISISDVRFFPNQWCNHILFREMEHETDWKGKTNKYCNLNELSASIGSLVKYF